MTAGPTPAAPVPPGPPPPAADPLVVRTDRRLVGRLVWRGNVPLVLAMLACVAAGTGLGALAGSTPQTDMSATLGALMGALGAAIAFTVALSVFLFASVLHMVHREVDVMAVVEPTGLHVAVPGTNAGSAYLPWHAIGSVTPRGRGRRARLVVRAVPGLRRDHPGARGLEDDLLWRSLRSQGLTIRTGTALVPHEHVLAAVRHLSSPRGER
ncbi:hypothetical protein [Actinotalea solisilvae]|uniref:hypothetical protein n=1 Tax=Actinotalea solisilvae TaxID=2072922 RepID=UPI0018F1F5CD|nr:hypothetical protein [Actinotalea solisilvae]